jgi:hypothetical protein
MLECYVADEIITTRANKRVRVGNTVRTIFCLMIRLSVRWN